MRAERLFVKSAIGATTVTLTPSTGAESKPGHVVLSQIVVTTGAATPDVGFWGTTTTDGTRYKISIERES
jgi:hypothetical protein